MIKDLSVSEAFNRGFVTKGEAVRLRTNTEPCPRCKRPSNIGEIEDLGMCVHCDHIIQDGREALESYDCLEDLEVE